MPDVTAADLLARLADDLAHDEAASPARHRDELVTLAEAARRLGRPYGTVGRWLAEGRFRSVGAVGRTLYVSWGAVVEAEYRIRMRRRGARPPDLAALLRRAD